MRILIAHNQYRTEMPSGENEIVDFEARELEAAGCDVFRYYSRSDTIAEAGTFERVAVPARVVWSHRSRLALRRYAASIRPDVLHVHNTFPLMSPTIFREARAIGLPVVHTLHNFRPLCATGIFLRQGEICEQCVRSGPIAGVVHGCYRDSRLKTIPLALMQTVHRAAGTWAGIDKLIAPSVFLMDKFVAAGWPEEKFVVKPNSCPDPGVKRAGGGSEFLYIGRLSVEKGVDLLIRAWCAAFPHGGQVLRVIGDGPEFHRLRALAASFTNGGSIQFTGRLEPPEVNRALSGARALIIPSRCYEVFPRVACEAYAFGVPVVGFGIGSLRGIVRHDETGLLCDAAEPESLADALRALAAEPKLSERLGQGARSLYEAHLHPEVTTRQLIDIYGSVSQHVENRPKALA